jgi:uncharacterized membrane protein YfcA
MTASRRWLILLIWPSFLGGMVGTLLVTRLDEKYFWMLVPWLILGASVLFLLQSGLAHWSGIGKEHAPPHKGTLVAVTFFQFLVAVYGGYFGAGIGILMLSALGMMGLGDIHRMNALKTLLGFCINIVAVLVFVWEGKVVWQYALSMAVAAIIGGYLGARIARRLNRNFVRWIVILIGFGLAGYYFYKQWTAAPAAETKPNTVQKRDNNDGYGTDSDLQCGKDADLASCQRFAGPAWLPCPGAHDRRRTVLSR